jgi:hypothetical protein
MPLELLGALVIFIYLLSTILTAGGRNQSLLKMLYKEMPLGRALGCKRNCQKPAVMSMLVNWQLRKCEEIVLSLKTIMNSCYGILATKSYDITSFTLFTKKGKCPQTTS